MRIKSIFSIVLSLVLVFCFIPFGQAFADVSDAKSNDGIVEMQCGDRAYAHYKVIKTSLDGTEWGRLDIDTTDQKGIMDDYKGTIRPWEEYADKIIDIDIYDIDHIGSEAFRDMENLKTVDIYGYIGEIGEDAFKGLPSETVVTLYFTDYGLQSVETFQNLHDALEPYNIDVLVYEEDEEEDEEYSGVPASPDESPSEGRSKNYSSQFELKESYFEGFKSSVTYTGKKITLDISCKVLKEGEDYTIKYKNNKDVGTASVTIKGKGMFKGSFTKTFKIRPLNVKKIKYIKAYKRTLTVKWQKQSEKMSGKHITGYQIKVSTSKIFTKKTTKEVTVKGYKKTSTRIKGLKSGKKYYVKMRTYMKTGDKTYYSPWSKVKTIKIRSEANSESNKKTIYIYTDYPQYVSLEELADNSDLIVYGKVIGKSCDERSLQIEKEGEASSEEPKSDKDIVTISKIKILDEFTGTLDSSNISVIQLGGETDQKKVINKNSPNLKKGMRYVFFLKKSTKWDNTYWLLNDTQAVYVVDKEKMSIKSDVEGLSFDWLKNRYNDKL